MYNTSQYRAIVQYFTSKGDRPLSSLEVIESLCPNGQGKSTVYRLLGRMSDTGELRRFHEGKHIYYQYSGRREDCDRHFHLKCRSCGRLIHLDCEHTESFAAHVFDHHGFSLDMRESVLYGRCGECEEEKCSKE